MIAAVAATFGGGLASLLKMAFWYGAIPAAAVSSWATFKVARAFQTMRQMGEMLVCGGPVEVPLDPRPDLPPPALVRRIVILCDGTGNRPPADGDPAATNIWKPSQALIDEETQTIWYDPGVATGTSRPARMAAALEQRAGRLWLTPIARVLGYARRFHTAWEGLTGTGVAWKAARNLSTSTGRATASTSSASRGGLYRAGHRRGHPHLRHPESLLRYVPAVVSLHSARRGWKDETIITGVPIAAEFAWRDLPIEMLGVFDTVASLGAPLWGWWFKPRGHESRALNTSPMPNDETARRPSWSSIGTWPRWAKVLDELPSTGAGMSVHGSVFERAGRILSETGGHDLHVLQPGETLTFRVEAQRHWDRTGLIIEGHRERPIFYRLRWVGGLWRDANCPPCGPGGSEDSGLFSDLRRWARWRRRVRHAPWMTLCATIAGPRRWPLRELPLREAFAFMFIHNPKPLLEQIAPIGIRVRQPGCCPSPVLGAYDRPEPR